MKAFILALFFVIYSNFAFSQKMQLDNDLVELNIRPLKDEKDNVLGFCFTLVNKTDQQIFTGGKTNTNEVACNITIIADKLLVLCGGTTPALYDYMPNTINLIKLSKNDTLQFNSNISQQYKGNLVIEKSVYEKMKKVFVIDYMIIQNNRIINPKDYPFSEFIKSKNRLTLEINPN